MGLFERKTCNRCGKELGLIFGKIKIADGYLCKDCNSLLSPYLSNKSKLTLSEIEEHIEYRQQNQIELASFTATTIVGIDEKVYIDDNQGKFVISSGKDFISKNADVFSRTDIASCDLVVDEDREEIYQKDKEGNNVPFDPPRFDTLLTYKIEMALKHKWIKSLTIKVNKEPINTKDRKHLFEIDHLANDIVTCLIGVMLEDGEMEGEPEHWICLKCGEENAITSKFCTNCGEAKSVGKKFCGECGVKLPEGIKFCPNCGKQV